MDQATREKMEEVVQGFIDADEMFSAFDVTKTLRNTHGMTVYHSEVKKAVHGMYDSWAVGADHDYLFDGYGRSIVHTSNFSVLVYAPAGKNANDYDPDNIDPKPAPVSATTNVSQKPATVGTGISRCNVDNRGRLLITAALVKGIGLTPGDTAHVSVGTSKLVVSSVTLGTATDRTYVVDKDNAIRISRRVLRKVGLGNNVNALVTVNGTTLVVG